jgi:hypothetical protein
MERPDPASRAPSPRQAERGTGGEARGEHSGEGDRGSGTLIRKAIPSNLSTETLQSRSRTPVFSGSGLWISALLGPN